MTSASSRPSASYLGGMGKSESANTRLFRHQQSRIDVDRASTTNDDNSSDLRSEQLQIIVQIDVRQHLDD